MSPKPPPPTSSTPPTTSPPPPFTNLQVVLRERPAADIDERIGEAGVGTFELRRAPLLGATEGQLEQGDVLVRVEHLSLDPAMRGWLRDVRSYLPPVQIGEVMRAGGQGVVVRSRHADFDVGDVVTGTLGWQQYAVLPGSQLTRCGRAAEQPMTDRDKVDLLAHLGSSGLTAWVGLFKTLEIRGGEVLVVTGAAGSVGVAVVQMAKIKGCTVIAVAGGPEKCRWLKEELGADEAIDYKAPGFERTFREIVVKKHRYAQACFDNVGGEQLDLMLGCMRPFGKIACCGAISDYNRNPTGLRNYLNVISMRLTLRGFIVLDHARDYGRARDEMRAWMREGKMKSHVTLRRGGVEEAPAALAALFRGENRGKMVLRVVS